jgi:hypothetical protein
VFDPAGNTKPAQTTNAMAGSAGGFQKGFLIALTDLPGTAKITACDTNNLCASTTISIT